MTVVSALRLVSSTFRACISLGAPRATWYRRQKPAVVAAAPKRPHPASLTDGEKAAVMVELTNERFCDVAVPEVYATLLDEGRFFCSMSTMYRVLRRANLIQDRRKQVSRAHYPRPELLATAPNHVWSWDISVPQKHRREFPLCNFL